MPRATIQTAMDNYGNSISLVPERYQAGIANADWKTAVSGQQANQNWKDGIQSAISNDSWTKGIEKVSNDTWKNAAATKGAASIATGMRNALPKYQRNFAPILEAMNSRAASLPPKTTDFRQNIANRVIPIVEAAKQAAGKPY